ncbi:MAG: hypothetical protein CMM46_16220 [Rhodospirillaceae bacterium]|nr:hypothetical protein [Rhodospirillaceae bacterium]
MPSRCSFVWPPAMPEHLKARTPELNIDLVIEPGARALESLGQSHCEAAVSCGPVPAPHVKSRALFRDEIVALLPSGHDLCDRGYVRPSDLVEPALISDQAPAGEDMPMQLVPGSAGLRAGRCLEAGFAESVLRMVSSGWGLRWSAVPSRQMTKTTLLSWYFQWADADFP